MSSKHAIPVVAVSLADTMPSRVEKIAAAISSLRNGSAAVTFVLFEGDHNDRIIFWGNFATALMEIVAEVSLADEGWSFTTCLSVEERLKPAVPSGKVLYFMREVSRKRRPR